VSLQELPPGEDTALLRRMGGVNRLATSLFLALTAVLTLAQLGG
jgi:hypothetical protein